MKYLKEDDRAVISNDIVYNLNELIGFNDFFKNEVIDRIKKIH